MTTEAATREETSSVTNTITGARWVDSASGRVWDGCYICGGPVAGSLMVVPREKVGDHYGRATYSPERRAPVCVVHARTIRCANTDAKTMQAVRANRAGDWRARQTVLFDGRAFQVGSSAHGQRGWWER
ncbi:MAG: hypothetical protein ACXVH3_35010 [Solirubrobacteraceae bacterium]